MSGIFNVLTWNLSTLCFSLKKTKIAICREVKRPGVGKGWGGVGVGMGWGRGGGGVEKGRGGEGVGKGWMFLSIPLIPIAMAKCLVSRYHDALHYLCAC